MIKLSLIVALIVAAFLAGVLVVLLVVRHRNRFGPRIGCIVKVTDHPGKGSMLFFPYVENDRGPRSILN